MSTRRVSVVLLALLAMTACDRRPAPGDFSVGMTRAAVVATFGDPERTRTLIRDTEHVWGPIEDFWLDVVPGAHVEIWYYPARGGTVELYFVNDSATVLGTGFAPEGAVF
ncbi:hypothetical protein H0Z60_10995 [Ectothiorhodospiraceae bacterium WFHF3C12]|nr:hypothetical protein [Ectothiorhodospiraceae bacterium WFHF3C12]